MRKGITNYLDNNISPLAHSGQLMNDPEYIEYQDLIGDQFIIGWDHLLRGKLSTHWQYLQKQFELTQNFIKKQHKISTKFESSNSTPTNAAPH